MVLTVQALLLKLVLVVLYQRNLSLHAVVLLACYCGCWGMDMRTACSCAESRAGNQNRPRRRSTTIVSRLTPDVVGEAYLAEL